MAIYEEEQSMMGSEVVSKEIEEGAEGMMIDLVQKYQYAYPIKSAVRELLSNAVDAVTEKQNAIKILTGQAKPGDYYIERDGALYKDSKWNPDYYPLNKLSSNDTVTITYKVSGDKRDQCIIEDYGVGLWGKRLLGYFRLGYSTKRGSVTALGKYGIGAKSALSTGINSYIVESRYDGKLLRFHVFDYAYQPIIPPVDLETGKENPFFIITDREGKETKVHYTYTDKENGLTVTLECKQHNKVQYLDAVKQQMMYFPNIQLIVEEANGRREIIPTAAEILYEDENIILSDNNYYNKPHMLINRVNYGYINFDEIELEQRYGNIGIKVQAEEVTINPSRESVIWDDKTRAVVLQRYKDVVSAATRLLNESLTTENYIDWLYIVNSIDKGSYAQRNNIISRLSEIANIKDLEIHYTLPGGEILKYKDVAGCYAMRLVEIEQYERAGNVVNRIKRTRVSAGILKPGVPVYIKTQPGASSNKTDKYLFKKHGSSFVILEHFSHAHNYAWFTEREYGYVPNEKEMQFAFELLESHMESSAYAEQFSVYELVVPDDDSTDEEEDLIEAASDDKEAISTEVIRTKKETITMGRPIGDMNLYAYAKQRILPLSMYNEEVRACDIEKKLISPEVFYFNQNDDDYKKVMLAMCITHLINEGEKDSFGRNTPQGVSTAVPNYKPAFCDDRTRYPNCTLGFSHDKNGYLNSGRVSYIKVAKNNVKYFRQYKHISSFFAERRGNTVKMSTSLIKWNTARLLEKNMHKCRFLANFSGFDPVMASEYRELVGYMRKWYRKLTDIDKQGFKFTDEGDIDALVDHCQRIYSFQRKVAELSSDPANAQVIADEAKALFGDANINAAHGADLSIINRMEALVDYCEPLIMLNAIPQLTGDVVSTEWPYLTGMVNTIRFTEDLEREIKDFIQLKTKQHVNND